MCIPLNPTHPAQPSLKPDFITDSQAALELPPKDPNTSVFFFPFIGSLSLGIILTCFSVHLFHHFEVPQSFITEVSLDDSLGHSDTICPFFLLPNV